MPSNFFGESVSGVTALLGVNGSGKTTALELICRCITEHYHFNQEYILVYKIGDDFYLSTNLKKKFLVNFPFVPDNENEKLRGINTIYFSNVFDQNHLEFNDKVIDVSINRKMNPRYMYRDDLKRKVGEVESQIIFLGTDKSKEIGFDIPTRIEYKIYRNTSELLKKVSSREVRRINNPELIEKLIENLRKLFVDERRSYKVREGIKYTSLVFRQQFITSIINYHPESVEKLYHITEKLGSNYDSIDILNEISRMPIMQLEEYCISDIINIILLDFDHWLRKFNYDDDTTIRGGRHTFTLHIDDKNLWHHGIISHICEIMIGLGASWHGISSGQKAYLNMFSSIWNCIEEKNKEVGCNQSLICIDEGDLYLHPQWQIEFIDRLTRCLPAISNGNVQIIFTTHSPLLVSDMPSQCVCVLNAIEKNRTTLRTFGANIYDIYREVFGLVSSRTGNISNRYIQRVLEILDKDSLNKKDLLFLKEAEGLIDNKLILQHIKIKLKDND